MKIVEFVIQRFRKRVECHNKVVFSKILLRFVQPYKKLLLLFV